MYLRLALLIALASAGCKSSGDDTSGADTSGDDTAGEPAARNPGTPDAGNPGNPDAPPAACGNIAGTWEITGASGADLCVITQVGCAITEVDCVSGAHSTSGTLTGNNFSYTGVSGTGVPATCSGTISGNDIAGTCTTGPATCPFTGDRQ